MWAFCVFACFIGWLEDAERSKHLHKRSFALCFRSCTSSQTKILSVGQAGQNKNDVSGSSFLKTINVIWKRKRALQICRIQKSSWFPFEYDVKGCWVIALHQGILLRTANSYQVFLMYCQSWRGAHGSRHGIVFRCLFGPKTNNHHLYT